MAAVSGMKERNSLRETRLGEEDVRHLPAGVSWRLPALQNCLTYQKKTILEVRNLTLIGAEQ